MVIRKPSIFEQDDLDLPQVARVTASLSPVCPFGQHVAQTSVPAPPLTEAVYERIVHKPDVKACVESIAQKQCGNLLSQPVRPRS